MTANLMSKSATGPNVGRSSGANARLLVIGGDDHALRIPFLVALRNRGFDVAAAATQETDEFTAGGFPYFTYRFDRFLDPLTDWNAFRSLKAIIGRYQPDIVQCFDTKPCILGPLAARRMPRVRIVRTINGLGWVFSSRSLLATAIKPVYTYLHRVTAPMTALTVFQNLADQAHFKRNGLVGSDDHRLIPGSGVDVTRFDRAAAGAPSSNELRLSLRLGAGPIVITVTRLSRIKGIATLLAAAKRIHDIRPNVNFLLVGSRETEGSQAISQAEIDLHAPYVRAIGNRSDVPALLRLSDVFAFPTELFEGVPRVLLEAAAAGLPIVTSDMPGCVDVVRDGISGYVIPPRDHEKLAERIMAVLDDPNGVRAMAERAGEFVRREFNLERTVDRYADAYAEISRRGRTDGPDAE